MVTFFIGLLLFCFNISNASTRIFVAVTSVVVLVLVGWCIRTTAEARFSGLLTSIQRTLDNVRAMCHRILALIDLRSQRESPSSATLNRAGSVHSSPNHEGVGVVV